MPLIGLSPNVPSAGLDPPSEKRIARVRISVKKMQKFSRASGSQRRSSARRRLTATEFRGRRAELLVGCDQPPRRPILCRRHSERGFEQSAKMGGIIETPPIGNLGYGGPCIRSVQFGSAAQETSPPHPPRYSHALFAEQRIKISNRDAIIFSNLLRR